MSQCPASHFRLSGLPLELRRTIYEACLTSSEAIHIDLVLSYETRLVWNKRKHHNPDNQLFNADILLVSRQIYEEAAPVLYGRNTFMFSLYDDGWTVFSLFESRLTNICRNEIRRLDFCLARGKTFGMLIFPASAPLELLPKLEILRLQVAMDIGSDRLGLFKYVEELKGNAQVTLVVESIGSHGPYGRKRPLISIDASMVDAMRRWGWTVTGEFDVKRSEHKSDGDSGVGTWF